MKNEIATRDNLPWPNCDSDGKADNKGQAFINTDRRRFKIQGDMGPPPLPWQGLKEEIRRGSTVPKSPLSTYL